MKELDLACVTSVCKPVCSGWNRFWQTANNHLVNFLWIKHGVSGDGEYKEKLNTVPDFQENYEI